MQLNLQNEILVLKSYRLLKQVVDTLHLDMDYYLMGDVKDTQVWQVPFVIERRRSEDGSLGSSAYFIELTSTAFLITWGEDAPVEITYNTPDSVQTELPFSIRLADELTELPLGKYPYKVVFRSPRQVALSLSNRVDVWPTVEGSEILSLALSGQSTARSEAILNTIIQKFNQDGISDRKEVSQRTIDFIDNRFVYLSKELDSIETGKQTFKESYDLAYIEADAGVALGRKSEYEIKLSELQTQLSLTEMLKENLEAQGTDSLLPGTLAWKT